METFRLRLRLVITAAFSLLGQAAMCRLLLKDDDKALLPSLQFANRFPELVRPVQPALLTLQIFQIVAVFTIGCSVLSQLFGPSLAAHLVSDLSSRWTRLVRAHVRALVDAAGCVG